MNRDECEKVVMNYLDKEYNMTSKTIYERLQKEGHVIGKSTVDYVLSTLRRRFPCLYGCREGYYYNYNPKYPPFGDGVNLDRDLEPCPFCNKPDDLKIVIDPRESCYLVCRKCGMMFVDTTPPNGKNIRDLFNSIVLKWNVRE